MKFHDPQFLLLLLLLIPLTLLLRIHAAKTPSIRFANGGLFDYLPETFRSRSARIISWYRLPILALLIIALARPQIVTSETKELKKTVDIMIALDISSSMLAEDRGQSGLHKNRLAVAKETLSEFIKKRAGDRIGLIAFSARAYPAAPLTLDHNWLKGAVERLEVGIIEDGTAVGDGIIAGLNRLRNKETTGSQTIILITDGRNNIGTSPETAAAAAAAVGIRVHTVGIGSAGSGRALFRTQDPLGGISYREIEADLDEITLQMISDTTGGRYFKADDKNGLEQVFSAIDWLEKRPIEQKIFYSYYELFPVCIIAILVLFALFKTLQMTILRRMP